METKIASQVILANMNSMNNERLGDPSAAVSLNQIKMWLVPQKTEHDLDYDINHHYFETLLRNTLDELVAGGYIISSINESIEDGDPQMFSLTQKGAKYVEELIVRSDEA